MNELQQKIIDISKKLKLSHIGSNLSCLPILEEIYAKKKSEDIIILDNAHAHLAHLIVKAFEGEFDFRKSDPISSIEKYGIHCDRKAGCDASGGSLGHGIGIGIGYAIADRDRDVYIIVSDGSMMEGSNWEALRIAGYLTIKNLHIYCNFNGYTAVNKLTYDKKELLIHNMEDFVFESFDMRSSHKKNLSIDLQFRDTNNTKDFEGVQGHYKVI